MACCSCVWIHFWHTRPQKGHCDWRSIKGNDIDSLEVLSAFPGLFKWSLPSVSLSAWCSCLTRPASLRIDVLALVHGRGDRNHSWVTREYEEIRAYYDFERLNADFTYLELLKPDMLHHTHFGVFTQIWSQLTGMNVMMYYITYAFAMAGLKGNNLLVSSSIQYVINAAMTVPELCLGSLLWRNSCLSWKQR